jgi:hypothetical protein
MDLDSRALLASTPCIGMLNATPELMVLLRLAASCCSMPESSERLNPVLAESS